MKALVYTGPKQLDWREVAEPKPRAGEVVLRVDSVCICGSDMHAYLGHDERRPAPCILGHEVSGVIEEGVDAGRRVTVNPLVSCHQCPACLSGRDNICANRQIISMPPREGAYAERLAMPLVNLTTVPDHVDMEKAALAEPLACGWHAVRVAEKALAQPLDTSDCLVLGGGAIGLGVALVLLMQGAKSVQIAETNPIRREALLSVFGDDARCSLFDPTEQKAEDASVDLVIDAVGFASTRAEASRVVRPGGVIAHIGLGDAADGLDIRRMTLQEITFIGTYTYSAQDFRDTAQAIFAGKFGALDWIDIRPLEEGADAFQDILAGKVAASKVVLKPTQA